MSAEAELRTLEEAIAQMDPALRANMTDEECRRFFLARPATYGIVVADDGDPWRTRVSLRRAADIPAEPIRWLWAGFLALAKMIVLAGVAGTAKTTLALYFAAVVSTGGTWPDGTRSRRGAVIMWSGEDDPADTLVPRLTAMGADLTRIYFVGGVYDDQGRRAFDPASDVDLLEDQLTRIPEALLLIVDPIVSAVAADSHKNGEVRRGLQPLVDLAARHGCCLLGITHYTKGTSGRDPLERVTGSLAFGALARVVLGTAKPTDENASRRLVRAKSNIGPDGGGFEFDIEHANLPDRPGLSASRVVWHSALAGTARDLLAEVEKEPEQAHPIRDDAKQFLLELLAEGPMLVCDVQAEAQSAGHAWATVRRAKDELGLVSRRDKGSRRGPWRWCLPDQAAPEGPDGLGAHDKVLTPKP